MTKFVYGGSDLIAEYNGSNVLQRRYIHGPGMDQPLMMIDSGGNKYWYHTDDEGSIIGLSNASGVMSVNTYDEYGNPGSSNNVNARFGYTGQTYLSEIGMSYYKARIYNPAIGRFMQPDPIGYADGLNLYAYTHNDPINGTDPWGLDEKPVTVTAPRPKPPPDWGGTAAAISFPNPVTAVILPPASIGIGIADLTIYVFAQRPKNNSNSCSTGGIVAGAQYAQAIPEFIDPTPFLEFGARPPLTSSPIDPLQDLGIDRYPTDPTKPPGPGYEWRTGTGSPPGKGPGSWFNPKTDTSLHPDLDHEDPIGPHWDIKKGSKGPEYRWFPDGRITPKAAVTPGFYTYLGGGCSYG